MCVSVRDLSGRAACGNCGENVDIAPGAARRWLLGWRRRRRPSRRTRRAAAPCPARAPRRCLPRGPGGTGLGPPRPGWPLPSAPLPAGSPTPDDPPPGARSQTEVRAAAANNVPLWLASETCLLCASRPGGGCWRWRAQGFSRGSARVCFSQAGPWGGGLGGETRGPRAAGPLPCPQPRLLRGRNAQLPAPCGRLPRFLSQLLRRSEVSARLPGTPGWGPRESCVLGFLKSLE